MKTPMPFSLAILLAAFIVVMLVPIATLGIAFVAVVVTIEQASHKTTYV